MKFILLTAFTFSVQLCFAQNFNRTQVKKDNYTVQYLIILNDKDEIVLQKNSSGWHTLAIRSNEPQSIREALDSLAMTTGFQIDSLKLAGLFTYKFHGLQDHREIAFRSYYIAKVRSGKLVQPDDSTKSYHWTPVAEAMNKITIESMRMETTQILKNPGKVWGGSFLITWKDDKLIGTSVLEKFYCLAD